MGGPSSPIWTKERNAGWAIRVERRNDRYVKQIQRATLGRWWWLAFLPWVVLFLPIRDFTGFGFAKTLLVFVSTFVVMFIWTMPMLCGKGRASMTTKQYTSGYGYRWTMYLFFVPIVPAFLAILADFTSGGNGGVYETHRYPLIYLGILATTLAMTWHRYPGACAKCSFDASRNPTATSCPECGNDLTTPGNVAIKRIRHNPKVKWVAYPALAAVMFGPLISMMFVPAFGKSLPTSAIVWLAPHNFWAGQQLKNRTLTDDQVQPLVEAALEQRGRPGFRQHVDPHWAGDQVAAGRVSEDLKERWLETALDVWLRGPDEARVGEPVEIIIACEVHSLGGQWVSAIYPGTPNQGVPDRIATSDTRLSVYGISLGRTDPQHREPETILRLTPTTPGTITIEWPVVVTHSRFHDESITWQDDGTYTFNKPPDWHTKIILTHELRVTQWLRETNPIKSTSRRVYNRSSCRRDSHPSARSRPSSTRETPSSSSPRASGPSSSSSPCPRARAPPKTSSPSTTPPTP